MGLCFRQGTRDEIIKTAVPASTCTYIPARVRKTIFTRFSLTFSSILQTTYIPWKSPCINISPNDSPKDFFPLSHKKKKNIPFHEPLSSFKKFHRFRMKIRDFYYNGLNWVYKPFIQDQKVLIKKVRRKTCTNDYNLTTLYFLLMLHTQGSPLKSSHITGI